MENETKSVDEFLGGLKTTEDKDPFGPQDNADDTLNLDGETGETGETGESGETGETGPEQKRVPFHQDPKIQRYIEREIEKRISKQKPALEKPTSEPDNLDEILTRIIGNDTPEKVMAVKDLKKELIGLSDRSVQTTLQQLEANRQEELKAEREAEESLMDGFESIEQEHGIDITSNAPLARKTRNQFIDFVKKIAPKDQDGDIVDYPDLPETFRIFKSIQSKAQPTQKAKELASRSLEKGLGGDVKPLSEDKSWGAVDRIFEKLTG